MHTDAHERLAHAAFYLANENFQEAQIALLGLIVIERRGGLRPARSLTNIYIDMFADFLEKKPHLHEIFDAHCRMISHVHLLIDKLLNHSASGENVRDDLVRLVAAEGSSQERTLRESFGVMLRLLKMYEVASHPPSYAPSYFRSSFFSSSTSTSTYIPTDIDTDIATSIKRSR